MHSAMIKINMSCSVFFNHGRTSTVVVVGDVLWCGEERWVISYGVVRKGG